MSSVIYIIILAWCLVFGGLAALGAKYADTKARRLVHEISFAIQFVAFLIVLFVFVL